MNFDLLNMSESSYLIIILWAFCVFVAWYFFKHTTKNYRFGFIKTFAMISILFFFILALTLANNRPPFNPVRIAIFPFPKQTSTENLLSWESLALSEIPTNYLHQINPQNLLPYKFAWLTAAVNQDSLVLPSYLLNFAKRINLDYAVLGNFKTHPSQYDLNFQIYNVKAEKEILNERIKFTPNEIFEFCTKLSRKILVNTVGIEGQGNFNNDWKSISQIQDYFNSKLYLFTNQREPALQFARQAVKKDSSSAVCLNFLAELFINRGIEKKANGESPLEDFRLARSTLSKILSFPKNNSTTLRLLGELSLANEKWHQAANYLRESLQLNPLDPNIYFDLTKLHAIRYADLGFKNEKELLQRAIYINPCFFTAQLTLANTYSLKNRYDLARKIVKEVLRINPVYVDGLMALGRIELAQNNILNTVENYEKVLALEPDNSDVYYNLGIVYYYQKDYDNAIKFFEHAVELDDHLDSLLYLAYIYELKGDMDKAIAYLQTRIKKRKTADDPYAEEARKHLFKIMSERGTIDSLRTNSTNQD